MNRRLSAFQAVLGLLLLTFAPVSAGVPAANAVPTAVFAVALASGTAAALPGGAAISPAVSSAPSASSLVDPAPMPLVAPLPVEKQAATEIASWTETVDLQPDGSARVTARVTFEHLAPGHLELPCSFARTMGAALEIDGPAAGRIETRAGVNLLALEVSGTPAPDRPLSITYLATGVFDPSQAPKTDFGNIGAKYQFVNTVLMPIASFTGVVLLPPGLVVNAVDSYLPKLKKEDPNDPYSFDLVDGRRRMTITVSRVKPGDRVMLDWRMKSTSRSPWLMLGLALISLAWLAAFRDILTPATPKPPHG